MTTLRRHQLAYLGAAGWQAALRRPIDAAAIAHLQDWSRRGLPLVVTRQPAACVAGEIALGWPAPLACSRMRVALQVPAKAIAWLDEFPAAREAARLLPRGTRKAVLSLLRALDALGTRPRAYGSYGWQLLSGMAYLHAASDLDLWLAVESQAQADAAVDLLGGGAPKGLQVDGELMFPGGAAVAWREYAAWRAGRARGMLIKRLDAVAVEHGLPLRHGCEAVAA